jgi:hypothetical protein
MTGNLLGGVTAIIVTGAIMSAQVEAREAEVESRREVVMASAGGTAYGAEVAKARRTGEIDGYIINLSLYAAAYAIGIFFWLKIDATKPIIPEEEQSNGEAPMSNPEGQNSPH